jgi:hypothetical protein
MSETHARAFVLADRLEQLADCVAHGPDAVRRNFTMQIPADPDRDADLVLSEAARLLRSSDAEITRLREQRDELLAALNWAHGCGDDFPERKPGSGLYSWRKELRELTPSLRYSPLRGEYEFVTDSPPYTAPESSPATDPGTKQA